MGRVKRPVFALLTFNIACAKINSELILMTFDRLGANWVETLLTIELSGQGKNRIIRR